MKKLNRNDLFSLEKYAEIRPEFRQNIMAHKKNRRVTIGSYATLYFEDRLIMQYQVQEMLRAERIFEAAAIQEELDTYNPLIPDGGNWKVTFMLEYADVNQRQQALAQLIGIEKQTWVQVNGFDRVYPISNEDLKRETEEKTSAVHFLRFELNANMIAAAKTGQAIAMGIDHLYYQQQVTAIAEAVRESLVQDLD